MIEYLKKDIKAFALGIASFFVLTIIYSIYWKILVSNEVVKINFDNALGTQTWNNHPLLIVSTIISALILILPGYLTGWHSKQNATLNGLIIIFVCTSVKFFSSSVFWKNFGFSLSEFYFLLRPWLESLILPLFVGAVSGAAGQYHSKIEKGLIKSQFT